MSSLKEIKETMEKRIKDAEESLANLEVLIRVGQKAGLDVTQYQIQMSDLKSRIAKWKEALKEFEK